MRTHQRSIIVTLGLGLALLGQVLIANEVLGVGLVGLVAGALLVAANATVPHVAASLPPRPAAPLDGPTRWSLTLAALIAAASTLLHSGGNRYTTTNVMLWLSAVGLFLVAHVEYPPFGPEHPLRRLGPVGAIRAWLTRERLVTLGLLLAILALGAVFRFAALADNPRDMNSDQAEKLLDVEAVLAGTNYIFFERNTGREPWQFYWTVGLIRLFDLPADFMALKLGTALIGWLMLPAVFLLGREVLGTRAALIATLFAAVASWGVITTRFGLRYPLAPCAAAWTLFFLVRGLRRDSRTSLLWAGVWAGIGLQGYTAYRFMPVVAPTIGLLWMLWLWRHGQWLALRRVLAGGLLASVVAGLTMLPLLRYGWDQPEQLFYRAATRLTSAEQAIPGEPLAIFANNLLRVGAMFNYTTDTVWVANLPDRPAMDPLLGALLVVGSATSLALSWRTRNPWPALTLLAGLLFLVPSALSIAFPGENPSVVRTGAALPALMIVCATGPALLLELLRSAERPRWAYPLLAGLGGLLLAVVLINQQRVFVAYPAQYCPRAQNASDMGRELLAWEAQGGDRRNAWIIGYPHWVDSRAVGVWIGAIDFPNTVLGADAVRAIELEPGPAWFLLNRDDLPALHVLYERFPTGHERLVEGSLCAGRAFVIFEAP